jgi:hypothetical protein
LRQCLAQIQHLVFYFLVLITLFALSCEMQYLLML